VENINPLVMPISERLNILSAKRMSNRPANTQRAITAQESETTYNSSRPTENNWRDSIA
jgi:hypothetical protein